MKGSWGAAVILLAGGLITGCASTPHYTSSPDLQFTAEQIATTNPTEMARRFGSYAQLDGKHFVWNEGEYRSWASYKWVIPGFAMQQDTYGYKLGNDFVWNRTHSMQYVPSINKVKFFVLNGMVDGKPNYYEVQEMVVLPDGTSHVQGLLGGIIKYDTASKTLWSGKLKFEEISAEKFASDIREAKVSATEVAAAESEESSDNWAMFGAILEGASKGFAEAAADQQQMQADSDYMLQNIQRQQMAAQARESALAEERLEESRTRNAARSNEVTVSSSTRTPVAKPVPAPSTSGKTTTTREVTAQKSGTIETKKDKPVTATKSSTVLVPIPPGVQPNTWSSWYILTSAGGATLKYRVYIDKTDTRYQWQILNSNSYPIYASVNEKKYVQGDGSSKSGTSEATTIKPNGSYTFGSDYVSGTKHYKIGARFVVAPRS